MQDLGLKDLKNYMMKELEKRRANKLLFLFDNYFEVRYNFGMVVKQFGYH